MDNLLKRAEEINKALLENKTVRDYLLIKEKIKESQELSEIEATMKEHQKLFCVNKDKWHKDTYLELEKQYNKHYLVVQYKALRDEVNHLFLEVSDIISKKWL